VRATRTLWVGNVKNTDIDSTTAQLEAVFGKVCSLSPNNHCVCVSLSLSLSLAHTWYEYVYI
jgi:hypothetical protein